MLAVNWLNCGVFLVALVLLGVYLPRRLKRRLGAYPTAPPAPVLPASPLPAAANSLRPAALAPAASLPEPDSVGRGPGDRIFYWYRHVVRLLMTLGSALFGPQETLREFAYERGRVLGPAAKHFVELTQAVERALYSRHGATAVDAESSERLSRGIEAGLRPGAAPTAPEGGEKPAGAVITRVAPERKVITSEWRLTTTWCWAMLVLALAYYAFVLLFVLPSIG